MGWSKSLFDTLYIIAFCTETIIAAVPLDDFRPDHNVIYEAFTVKNKALLQLCLDRAHTTQFPGKKFFNIAEMTVEMIRIFDTK